MVVDTAALIFSRDTVEELSRVLERPKFDRYVPRMKRVEFFDRVVGSEKVVDFVIPISACRDPDDDKFLSLALAGNADGIVTGDDDLLALHPFRGVAILTPQQFVERYESK